MSLVSKTFSDIITFTRASGATYFDNTGTLRTSSTNVPRFDYNPSTLAAQGLLIEEARTNLCLQSADFSTTWSAINVTVTANAVVSPDGTTNADNVFETVATAEHYVRQSFTGLTANSVYTITVFVKDLGGRNLRIRVLDTDNVSNGYQMTVSPSSGTVVQAAAAIGAGSSATGTISAINNGWYRVTLSGNAGATCTKYLLDLFSLSGTTSNFAGDITKGLTLFGAQLELGAFPTSYIPTTTTALTRAADVASVNTLSPWYNATEGTLYAEGSVFGLNATNRSLSNFTDGTSNNRISIFRQSDTQPVSQVISGGASQFTIGFGTNWTTETARKIALAFASADFATCLNGGSVFTQTSGTVPTVSALWLGSLNGSSQFQCGYLRRITYYPTRLSNVQLQAITA